MLVLMILLIDGKVMDCVKKLNKCLNNENGSKPLIIMVDMIIMVEVVLQTKKLLIDGCINFNACCRAELYLYFTVLIPFPNLRKNIPT